MATKNIVRPMTWYKNPGDNFFSLPKAYAVSSDRRYMFFNVSNLKPNTRYKVMLDNYPGQQFEDITDFSRPTGDSVAYNTHRGDDNGRMLYLRTDENGKLSFKTRPYGTDSATITGTGLSATSDFSNLWAFFPNQSLSDDYARNRVFLIEWSQVNNPESDSKVKTVKFEYGLDGRSTYSTLPAGMVADCTFAPSGQDLPVLPKEVTGNFYQAFYIDSKSVEDAETVEITDINLYLRRKPRRTGNSSGVRDPGISISLLECNPDGTPRTDRAISGGTSVVRWTSTSASPLAETATVFNFSTPVKVRTNAYYAIAVSAQDEGYVFWYNTKGDLLVNEGSRTEKVSTGPSSQHRGSFFTKKSFLSGGVASGNSREVQWQSNENIDLKFDVNIAEYDMSAPVEIKLVNQNYEFLRLSNSSPTWAPGEEVYKILSNEAGTVSITAGSRVISGTGTAFSSLPDGAKIVLKDSTTANKQQIFTVDRSTQTIAGSITDELLYVTEAAERSISGTYARTVVGEVNVYDSTFQLLRLINSTVNLTEYTANNSMRFETGDTIYGIETGTTATIDGYNPLPVNVFRTNMNGTIPTSFDVTTDFKFSEEVSPGVYSLATEDNVLMLNKPNHIKTYDSYILSRSVEVDQASNLHNPSSDSKSSVLTMTYTYNGTDATTYVAPTFKAQEMNLIAHRWNINNDSSNEHTNNGNAITRHISRKLVFGQDQKAEDVRVIVSAYRPRNTSVEVYAKIINSDDSDSFDNKNWTKLDIIAGADQYSDPKASNDYREYEYSFPLFPPSSGTLEGEFTSTLNSTTISTTTANVELLAEGDVIKLYDPLFEDNYGVFSIESVNAVSQEITLNESVSNVNIVADGLKIDTLSTPYTAFKNNQNDGIVRYFGTSGESYDNYDAVAVKIVLLSTTRYLVPKVDDYRIIGVSA